MRLHGVSKEVDLRVGLGALFGGQREPEEAYDYEKEKRVPLGGLARDE